MLLLWLVSGTEVRAGERGYFRFPAIHGDTVVFVAEGDLWKVSAAGGNATRLTSHAAEENYPAISPDGEMVAFSGKYEGPMEVYVMPLVGGVPTRLTYDGGANTRVQGWTPNGEVMFGSTLRSTLRDPRLFTVNPTTFVTTTLPLMDAAEGCFAGHTVFFTRYQQLRDNIKGYRGGRAQQIWKFDTTTPATKEAQLLTSGFEGTNRQPMCWEHRVYFISDRDGSLNIWSMDEGGGDLRQHTWHTGWDVRTASISEGDIAYQLGADIHILDLRSGDDRTLAIHLVSDFDQRRTRWVDNPFDFLTDAAVDPSGKRVALASRGQIFSAQPFGGRFAEVSHASDSRAQGLAFSSDGRDLFTVIDRTGGYEIWRYPADGIGEAAQVTFGARELRHELVPSPDGRYLVFGRGNKDLLVRELKTGQEVRVNHNGRAMPNDVAWSPDSKWIAFSTPAVHGFSHIDIADPVTGRVTSATSDRYEVRSPAFSADGALLYFVAERNIKSSSLFAWGLSVVVGPSYERRARVYAVALTPGARWPFAERGEVATAPPPAGAAVAVDLKGLADRQYELPLPAGDYRKLRVNGGQLYVLSSDGPTEKACTLLSFPLDGGGGAKPAAQTVAADVIDYEVATQGKRLLLRREKDFSIVSATSTLASKDDLAKGQVDLRAWRIRVDPGQEQHQIFVDAWRNHRDYFWDANMNGADWNAVRRKYEPLLERVTDKIELNDVIGMMVSEVGAMHSAVISGDVRKGTPVIGVGKLGADFTFGSDGFRIDRLLGGDPEQIDERSPLARSEVHLHPGDVITRIEGSLLSTPIAMGMALSQRDGIPTRITVKRSGGSTSEEITVTPISARAEQELRYIDWGYGRQRHVDETSGGKIGYLHLRGTLDDDVDYFWRQYFPLVDRDGLIIDLRGNGGGDTDSWILDRLLRKVWQYWHNPRTGETLPNPSGAFRGHVVALIDSDTYSDGETLAEGIRRLGIGTLIGVRTAGAGLWLNDTRLLRDNGKTRVAQSGSFISGGGTGAWFIENVGIAPDIVVENPPHATFSGKDAQLQAAMAYLLNKIRTQPIQVPVVPSIPNATRR